MDPQLLKNARLCMYGTTALVALVDPDHQNLWVANVGDCQAGRSPSFLSLAHHLTFPLVLVSPNGPLGWKSELLTTNHNCDNDAEISRVISEHPGEPECIFDRRVLGALAPTRCKFAPYHLPNTHPHFAKASGISPSSNRQSSLGKSCTISSLDIVTPQLGTNFLIGISRHLILPPNPKSPIGSSALMPITGSLSCALMDSQTSGPLPSPTNNAWLVNGAG